MLLYLSANCFAELTFILSVLQLLQAVTGQNPNAVNAVNVVIILCGVAKMFVGELTEEGEIAVLLAADKEAPLIFSLG